MITGESVTLTWAIIILALSFMAAAIAFMYYADKKSPKKH